MSPRPDPAGGAPAAPAPSPVRACLVPVPLGDPPFDRAAALAAAFSPAERDALRGRADRSVAGRLALKRALAGLWPSLVPGSAPDPADFELGQADDGRPVLRAAPGSPALRDAVRVSLAHSRTTAWGLAAGPAGEGTP